MDKKEFIKNYIKENFTDWELLALHNAYCESINGCDSCIYDMASFKELHDGMDILDIIDRVTYGDFRSGDEYWMYNAYGNLESFSYLKDYIDLYELTDYIIEYGESVFSEIGVDVAHSFYDDDTETIRDAFLEEKFPNANEQDKARFLLSMWDRDGYIPDYVTEDWETLKSEVEDSEADPDSGFSEEYNR